MGSKPEATSTSRFGERIAWCGLLVALVFVGVIRCRLLSVPLERDEGEYAYAAQLLLQGVPPYESVYSMKLPGIYAAYATLLAVFGETHEAIHTGLLLVNTTTTILVFLLARHLTNPLGAVVSAASFALLSLSQSVQGAFANAEHFVVLLATGGLFVLLQALTTPGSRASLCRLFAAGLLLGAAAVMKQHGLAFVGLAALYLLLDSLKHRPISRRRVAQRLACFAAGLTAVFTCLCLLMAWAGVFAKFWQWTIRSSFAYAFSPSLDEAPRLFFASTAAIGHAAPLLWGLIGCGILVLLTKRMARHHRAFVLMYAVLSVLSVLPGFHFRPHYFVLLLPCASLFAGLAASTLADLLQRFLSARLQYGIPLLLTAVCLGQSIHRERDFLFQMTPFQVSRARYWPNPFPESLKIGGFIREHTEPGDCVAVLGSEPQICFYSRRRSASAHVYMYPLMEPGDVALQMQRDFLRDIEARKPKYVVFVNVPDSWLYRVGSHDLIFRWLHAHPKEKLRLAGVAELFYDRTEYSWEPHVKWPDRSPYWIAVFERSG